MRPTGYASLTLILRFGWAVCLVVVCTGALLLPATVRTPGYFTALEAHRAAGWVLAVAAPVALLVHLVATGSRLRGVVGVGALVGVAYLAAGLIPHALDFPDAIGFVDLQRRLLADALHNWDLDAGPLPGAVALAAVLTLGGLLVAVGIVSRARERATSRWSGAALTLLGCWALFGGAVLHLQPRETVFGTLHPALRRRRRDPRAARPTPRRSSRGVGRFTQSHRGPRRGGLDARCCGRVVG